MEEDIDDESFEQINFPIWPYVMLVATPIVVIWAMIKCLEKGMGEDCSVWKIFQLIVATGAAIFYFVTLWIDVDERAEIDGWYVCPTFHSDENDSDSDSAKFFISDDCHSHDLDDVADSLTVADYQSITTLKELYTLSGLTVTVVLSGSNFLSFMIDSASIAGVIAPFLKLSYRLLFFVAKLLLVGFSYAFSIPRRTDAGIYWPESAPEIGLAYGMLMISFAACPCIGLAVYLRSTGKDKDCDDCGGICVGFTWLFGIALGGYAIVLALYFAYLAMFILPLQLTDVARTLFIMSSPLVALFSLCHHISQSDYKFPGRAQSMLGVELPILFQCKPLLLRSTMKIGRFMAGTIKERPKRLLIFLVLMFLFESLFSCL